MKIGQNIELFFNSEIDKVQWEYEFGFSTECYKFLTQKLIRK